ncbi:PTB domain-containing engulfment adapter protein 1 [Macrosteles quadrilineatus]|uniref:PTB domain-containing engulfment adapter protein 1 n=1 Tax=Macrosteles quadrilineatus TaxID=74068 RepID=UPI0023E1B8DA|nr:PTB domain-containing engulfment adapter protein 1 [Macrosteles quadrilineatus]XP_054280731.1 PTB domain-containing engulfment adapter protein 1 [Macrosteles quadrilineatus]
MRNSNLLKWGQNNKHLDKSQNRNWIHQPEVLQKGHIAYLVKFLGNTEVDQPKGIEVVKEGIRKLKFNHQLRKSEGSKIPKVELTISIDGVAIQEPKTKRILHQYPLHRISYCADDKGEKKFFSFIAKESGDNEQHSCFVFVSKNLAEEITLTIGQAFDLAYKRFLETSGRDLEVQRRLIILQQNVKRLEAENTVLRQRLKEFANGQIQNVDEYCRYNSISDITEVRTNNNNNSLPTLESNNSPNGTTSNGTSSQTNGSMLLLNLSTTSLNNGSSTVAPPVPPRSFEAKPFPENDLIGDLDTVPTVGTKLEGLLMDELEEDFNPRACENNTNNGTPSFIVNNNNGILLPPSSPPPLLAPPPKPVNARRSVPKQGPPADVFGSSPFMPNSNSDPFGMGDFNASGAEPSQVELENAIGLLDRKILEMKDGFSRGLSFGNEDFSLESLDPLRK